MFFMVERNFLDSTTNGENFTTETKLYDIWGQFQNNLGQGKEIQMKQDWPESNHCRSWIRHSWRFITVFFYFCVCSNFSIVNCLKNEKYVSCDSKPHSPKAKKSNAA